jgi:hypothetical protein
LGSRRNRLSRKRTKETGKAPIRRVQSCPRAMQEKKKKIAQGNNRKFSEKERKKG